MKQWARKALIFWALGWIFLSAAGIVVNFAYLYPLMSKTMPHQTVLLAKAMGVAGGVVLGIAWPAVVIVYMQDKSVKQAFARAADGSAVI